MRKTASILILTLITSIICSFGAMNVSAAIDDVNLYDDDIGVILDVDFTKLNPEDAPNGLAAYLENLGITLSGKYEISGEPQKAPNKTTYDVDFKNDVTVLKLLKDSGTMEGDTVIEEATPGTMTVKWDNGHLNGVYRIQMEIYQRGVDRQLMQSPVVFMDVKDTDYTIDGLDIARISYEDIPEGSTVDTKRVYANLLAGIPESSSGNYLSTNTNAQLVNGWSTIECIIDTTDGKCTASISTHPSQIQSRTFEDESIKGNFAPNQFTTIASATTTDHQCDLYIRKISVMGPVGDPIPTPVPDYEISSAKFVKKDGTDAASVTEASKINNVTIKRKADVEANFDVIIVEYANKIFNAIKIVNYDVTKEGALTPAEGEETVELSIDIPDGDQTLEAGIDSVKIMLWESFKENMKPISKYMDK